MCNTTTDVKCNTECEARVASRRLRPKAATAAEAETTEGRGGVASRRLRAKAAKAAAATEGRGGGASRQLWAKAADGGDGDGRRSASRRAWATHTL